MSKLIFATLLSLCLIAVVFSQSCQSFSGSRERCASSSQDLKCVYFAGRVGNRLDLICSSLDELNPVLSAAGFSATANDICTKFGQAVQKVQPQLKIEACEYFGKLQNSSC
eukprot:TRINITY_DN11000_c0_g2_i1.p1 TRINITY_DN11000_c0_g2~~TRINITY_DN11000_c0_g2_i1.p1  ORF type:complete len:111 (-),score=12.47 TRINITY_DN11000_c0_g2_i1:159-491(-)